MPPVGDRQTGARDKGREVQAMFAAIAPRYDLLNRVLSLGVDRLWRREAAREALARHPRRILDVATGTGDFALELKARAPQAEVVGSDFVPEMLDLAREKAHARHLNLRLEEGDALNLPYPDGSFDAVTCAFGFRNFADYARGLAEMWRVLAPGGRLVILEFPPPRPGLFGSLFRFYFRHLLPRVGALVSGNAGAYTYLPESTLAFLDPDRLAQLMRATGFHTRHRLLTFGIAAIHVGDKG
ncbi:bifunctional demethylmenaquinone methyltransferase/2-methoxy-6-polyprenyl-1,4-benzoquinol methylase UbiE [Deinococcus metallilatus]|nr:bifunctional demethylmenaquinone methyltransferase/2-methoxy-6-polyprenyl-1,4-benzoquinol methylase UbiE [Deinococcus metallilatus]QBY10209.1 bifunctional demethylmenaquinone methyltransferase/2-methoxy-6-polyprenyl-1,4-benzoquinol methylase UbiE [Deinococcus metallilatus]RXJ14187.1 bifunctional demethylmenaquinone methyltransferase/2-methoxy-6-polyprenyl-1,4-benzoquinol methylase UbiE [Deinococcus metallilatus]TLK30154.1 bifunctional demethylmenaquinone methyltransferase/2-methoxy-6-polypren